MNLYIQEAQQNLSKMNLKRSTPKHIIIKTVKGKNKKRTLKAAKEKQIISKINR